MPCIYRMKNTENLGYIVSKLVFETRYFDPTWNAQDSRPIQWGTPL